MFIGFLLLLLGMLLLLKQLDIIQEGIWDYFWPAAIIAVGLSMIFRHRSKKENA